MSRAGNTLRFPVPAAGDSPIAANMLFSYVCVAGIASSAYTLPKCCSRIARFCWRTFITNSDRCMVKGSKVWFDSVWLSYVRFKWDFISSSCDLVSSSSHIPPVFLFETCLFLGGFDLAFAWGRGLGGMPDPGCWRIVPSYYPLDLIGRLRTSRLLPLCCF